MFCAIPTELSERREAKFTDGMSIPLRFVAGVKALRNSSTGYALPEGIPSGLLN